MRRKATKLLVSGDLAHRITAIAEQLHRCHPLGQVAAPCRPDLALAPASQSSLENPVLLEFRDDVQGPLVTGRREGHHVHRDRESILLEGRGWEYCREPTSGHRCQDVTESDTMSGFKPINNFSILQKSLPHMIVVAGCGRPLGSFRARLRQGPCSLYCTLPTYSLQQTGDSSAPRCHARGRWGGRGRWCRAAVVGGWVHGWRHRPPCRPRGDRCATMYMVIHVRCCTVGSATTNAWTHERIPPLRYLVRSYGMDALRERGAEFFRTA